MQNSVSNTHFLFSFLFFLQILSTGKKFHFCCLRKGLFSTSEGQCHGIQNYRLLFLTIHEIFHSSCSLYDFLRGPFNFPLGAKYVLGNRTVSKQAFCVKFYIYLTQSGAVLLFVVWVSKASVSSWPFLSHVLYFPMNSSRLSVILGPIDMLVRFWEGCF